MSINQKKILSVINLSAKDRYAYFVRKTTDFEEVWGLYGPDGWATSDGNGSNRLSIPFWPESDFAELCATDEWMGMIPKSISLHEFIDRWLPGLKGDSRLVAVFPVTQGSVSIVEPEVLLGHLLNEGSQYE